MKIAVFGSTGGTGRLILAEAIRRGHDVTAFARRASALDDVTGLAGVVEGDGRDHDQVMKAVTGQQAVIMTVSARGEPGVVEGIAGAVTAAMAAAGVSRLVATSSYAIVATRPYVAAPLVRRIFAKAFGDQQAADRLIAGTGLDWTIARGTRLTGKPAAGAARQSTAGQRTARQSTELFTKGPYSLSRAAYAIALLELAESGGHGRQVINVTG